MDVKEWPYEPDEQLSRQDIYRRRSGCAYRKPGDLMNFQTYPATDALPPGAAVGDFKRIAQATKVKVDDVEIVRTGNSGSIVFGHALSLDGATEFGWTSTRNFDGKFVNETLDKPEPLQGPASSVRTPHGRRATILASAPWWRSSTSRSTSNE